VVRDRVPEAGRVRWGLDRCASGDASAGRRCKPRCTVDDWLYQRVAGIEPAAPGYAAITVKPSPVGDLRHASAHVDSPRGRISSSWTRTPKSFSLKVAIPTGATATVHVPAHRRGDVTRPPGATFTGMSGAYATFTVPPGSHTFVSAR
jgi:alpha-L-rhamnosidase